MKIDIKYGEQYDIFYYLENIEEKNTTNDLPKINIISAKENTSKYTYMEPKHEKDVPEEYIYYVLKRGSGFEDGKFRIKKYIEMYPKTEAIKYIKKEYGTGGSGWPIEGYGLHGYDTIWKANGISFKWRDAEGEKEGSVTWNIVYDKIKELIDKREYITLYDEERRKFHKLCKYLDNKYGYPKDWGRLPNNLYNKGIYRLRTVRKMIEAADKEAA